ncbi:cobalamin biosynthesis protein [Sporosarcina sp. 179-K 3D1 HS]|uniref:cobalt-precorrin 5A hydrolase n=1 Tax=Sporosarcina sp. 179-K 3D1 HS TaxID=3232169 RepID=UPI0039A0A704
MDNVVLVAITKHGVQLIRELKEKMPTADVYYMRKFAYGDEEEKGFTLFDGSIRLLLPDMFAKYDGIVSVISLGAMVRMIGPIMKNKKVDPAVVCVDDRGQFAISVLSGHVGGANDLTNIVAEKLGALPIITTASDVQKTIPVDIFGRDFGWKIEDETHIVTASASVVNEEPLVVVQEAGEQNWWKHERAIPTHIQIVDSCEEALTKEFKGALVITDRIIPEHIASPLLQNGVVYRPKSLHLGIGCNRGTSAEEIEEVILSTLQELQLSIQSVKGISTIDLKKDEVGLLEVCKKYGFEFTYYTPEELNAVPIENPSETVFKFTGAYGVSEPAAKQSAKADTLILEKKKSGNVTISIARQTFDGREPKWQQDKSISSAQDPAMSN